MQWIHTSSRTYKFNHLLSNPRKYDNRTSSSSSHGKFSWQLWNRNWDSFHGYSRSNPLGNYLPRKEQIRGECISPRSMTNSYEFWFAVGKVYCKIQRTSLCQDGVIFKKASRDRLRRKLRNQLKASETLANQVVEQTKSVDNEEFVHIGDRKWKIFPPVKTSARTLFLPRSRSLWSGWYAIMTSTKEKRTTPFIGVLWVPNWGMHFKHPEDNDAQIKIGFITLMKAAKLGSSVARISKVSYCTSVLFKDTQVERWWRRNCWVMS